MSWSVIIDGVAYAFPAGTSREDAESVLEEAKHVYVRELLLVQLRGRAEQMRDEGVR